MNTSQLWNLCLCAVGLVFLYLAVYFCICRFARGELSRSGASYEDGAIRIYAEAESLEYYLRIALAASGADRVTIIVNIPRNSAKKNEMLEIVRMMRRRHKNIFYTIT
jgi:hypothetical protein